jgi:ATP-binding cassette subfamily B protein
VLGVMALGGQRLLPVLQQAYASWSSVVVNIAPVSDVLDLLDQPLPEGAALPPPAPLDFQQAVRFDEVKFRYADHLPFVLDGLTLSIPRGIRIGIVGATGSGKSTLLDLLTALLEPTEGAFLVDGEPLTGARRRAWQRSVAHVPQTVYLSDATIAENIAMGTELAAIDMTRVKAAAAAANIAEFIESRPDDYLAKIGERGVRISGGERQRIAIARALYKQSSVLVFDEATSALDTATEQSVMETIDSLHRDLTVVIIAHRVSTVRHCDRIVELVNGRAVEYESYEQLLESSPSARQMPYELTR